MRKTEGTINISFILFHLLIYFWNRYFKQQEVTLWRKAPAKVLKGLVSTNIKYDKDGREELKDGETPGDPEAETTVGDDPN